MLVVIVTGYYKAEIVVRKESIKRLQKKSCIYRKHTGIHIS